MLGGILQQRHPAHNPRRVDGGIGAGSLGEDCRELPPKLPAGIMAFRQINKRRILFLLGGSPDGHLLTERIGLLKEISAQQGIPDHTIPIPV